MELRQQALEALQICDPAQKVARTRTLWDVCEGLCGDLPGGLCQPGGAIDVHARWEVPPGLPGRPVRPALVPPAQVSRRSPFTREGRAALLHAVAHIEFNAINLALDAVWRFADLPTAYYVDWLRVAAEEAHHFELLTVHLQSLDCRYGDFEAHDGLWTMVIKTSHDVTARMALVPRTLEARGLDATPPMQQRLSQAGDHRAVEILDVILRDEIGHVAIGNHWYGWLCERQGLDPVAHYRHLAQLHGAPRLRQPLNLSARRQAGFSSEEMAAMTET